MAADTFSSELGILSKGNPRLLTSWNFRKVPPGTNGGITLLGTLAGFLGASIVALTSTLLLPFCSSSSGSGISSWLSFQDDTGWTLQRKLLWFASITIWGGAGSLLDSALGGWFQASVIDVRTGKVVEGAGGKKVRLPISILIPLTNDIQVPVIGAHSKKDDRSSRQVESGLGFLDNNAVNILMAFLMSIGGMVIAGYLWKTE